MHFGEIELEGPYAEFAQQVEAFFAEHAGPSALAQEERTGDGFDEALHLAMGERGWLMDTWPRADGGAGLDRLQHRVLTLGQERTGLPFTTLGTTQLAAEAVRRYAQDDVRAHLMRGAATGAVRFCLGYTEPEGGSDVAAVRTHAEYDGAAWVVSGSKLFTTGAHNCQYAFSVVRTNADVPKHEGLTMLLVPLSAPGLEIRPLRTFGGERTNIVYLDRVEVPDQLRIGPLNGGWAVLHDRLDAEHSLAAGQADDGLESPSRRTPYATLLARCVDAVHEWAWASEDEGGGLLAESLDFRLQLGLVAVEAEAALSAPGHHGRVKASEALIEGSARLLELMGPTAFRSDNTSAAATGHLIETTHRYAQGTAIYGGTTEVFRNIIAYQDLGLPRPAYPG